MNTKRIIRGREITDGDIAIIKDIVEKYYDKGRKHISREICYIWKWYQANGATKDMACRYIMLKLEKEGHNELPRSKLRGIPFVSKLSCAASREELNPYGIKVKNLATRILSINAKRIEEDWHNKYGDKIYLLETFVEKDRFLGTCYKAGNWIYLGDTKGSQKSGSFHKYHGNIKKIFAYPLCKDFREKLIHG